MWDLILSVGLKLISLFLGSNDSKEKWKLEFYKFIEERKGERGLPAQKKLEFEELKKKLSEPSSSA